MTAHAPGAPRFADSRYLERLQRAAAAAAARDLDALLVTPSVNYRYLLGYRPPALERLTCLVVPADGQPSLVLPRLEEPLAVHQLRGLSERVEIVTWDETDDPYWLLRSRLPSGALRVGVEETMPARFVLRLQATVDPTELVEAASALAELRRVKSAEEVGLLRAAGAAADRAMRAILGGRFTGRSEREVSDEIRALLLAEGHASADFAIVGSGRNSASPHHEPGERIIRAGDAIVLDIGGTRDGFCSDTTRTAFVGEPPAEFRELYDVLQRAQEAACDAVRPGIAASAVDAVARDVIAEAGFGDAFIHRTGHGIGMETHEEPYLVAGNEEPLVPGNAFSVEPGIYLAGEWGARIEDILVCTETGGERLNRTSRDLAIVE